MKFDKVLTEQMYSDHLLWLNDCEIGKRLDLTGTNLYGTNLSGANLTSANLTDANLIGAILTRANLTGANLEGANLSSANLTGAVLRDANLSCAIITSAVLRDANLEGANLTRATLTNIKFNNCIGNKNQIKNLQLSKYTLVLCNNILAIGCKRYSVEKWYNFDDDTIAKMDSGALEWWTKHKDFIRQWIQISK
jgi:uncharacterized protein YjbI with pentapeptide repeats